MNKRLFDTWLAIVGAVILFGSLISFAIFGAWMNERAQSKPCDQYKNVSVQHIPARCLTYFQDAGIK